MNKLIFSLLVCMLLIQLPLAQAQILNPRDTVKSIDRSLEDLGDTNLGESNIGEDIIINVDSYQPKLITSDILEADNVDIMAQLKGTLTNPTITVPKIRGISVRSTNITTNPAGKKVSLSGIRYYKPKDTDLSFNNLGYLSIRINKIPNEEDIPDNLNIGVQASLDFDVSEGLGIKQYEAVLQSDEEKDAHKFFGGYLTTSQIGLDYAVFDLYDSQLKPVFKDLKVTENGLSQSLSYSNFAGPSSFGRLFDRFKIKLNDVREVGDRATFIIDGEQTVILSKGQPVYPGSRWIVDDIQISDTESSAKIILKDRTDKKGFKKAEFIIDNSQKFSVEKTQVVKVTQAVKNLNSKTESEVLNLVKDQRLKYTFNNQQYEFSLAKIEKAVDGNYVQVYVVSLSPYKQWKDYSLKYENLVVNPQLSRAFLSSDDKELPIYLKVDNFDQGSKSLYFTIYSQKTSSLNSQSLKLIKGTPLEFNFENNDYKFNLVNDFTSQNETPDVLVSYNKPATIDSDFIVSNNPPENINFLLSPLQDKPIQLELVNSDSDKGTIGFKIKQPEQLLGVTTEKFVMGPDGLPVNVADKYNQAIESYQKVIDEFSTEKDENGESASTMAKVHIGGIYVKLGQFSNAVNYLRQAYNELKDGPTKNKVSEILDALEVKKKSLTPSVQYLDEDSGKVQFAFIDFKKASLKEAPTATFEFNQNNQRVQKTFKQGELVKDQAQAIEYSVLVTAYDDAKKLGLGSKLFKFNTFVNPIEIDGVPKLNLEVKTLDQSKLEMTLTDTNQQFNEVKKVTINIEKNKVTPMKVGNFDFEFTLLDNNLPQIIYKNSQIIDVGKENIKNFDLDKDSKLDLSVEVKPSVLDKFDVTFTEIQPAQGKSKATFIAQKGEPISVNINKLRYEVKLTDLKSSSAIDTEWKITDVQNNAVKLMNTFDSSTKTVTVNSLVDSSTKLLSVNTLREAYITVIPDIEKASSTANFNLHIGIEKRPFGLPLFSKTIGDEINKTENLIKKLDNIINNAKKLHNFWIKFCFLTFGVLWSKNFFMNLVGASRDNIARDKVSDKWDAKWREEGKGVSYDKFIFNNEDAYNKDLANAGKVIDKIMDKSYKNELPSNLFADEKAKDSEDAKNWYFTKKFAETNKDDPKLQLIFAQKNTELYKQKMYSDIETQIYTKDNKPKSYAELTPEMKSKITSYMNVPYYTNGKDVSTLTDAEKQEIYNTDSSYFIKQYKENYVGDQWNNYFKDGGVLSTTVQKDLGATAPSKEFLSQIKNQYAPTDILSYTKQVVVDPRRVFTEKVDVGDGKGPQDYFRIKLEDGTSVNLGPTKGDIQANKPKEGSKYQISGVDYLVSTDEAYSLQNHKGLVSFYDDGKNKGKLQAISLDAKWYVEPTYSSTGTIVDYVVWERPEENSALGGGARIGSLNEVLDQQEKKAEKYKNRVEFKDRASRLESARTCISSINQKYGKTTPAQGEKLAKQCNDLGKYAVSNAVNQETASGCTKFMGPGDCKILFNACDPVLCPPSRCNLGGAWKVDNVIQSGIVGSTVLCAPNWVVLGGDIYTLPVCLTGIIAGLENINSNLKSYKECLVTAEVQKTNTGWCSRLRSFFLCDVLWRETVALQTAAVSAISKKVLGESEGSEYASFSNSFDEASSGLSYFTNDYAKEVFSVYQGGSLPEIGAEICKSFIGGKVPGIGNVLDQVTAPVSPPQFNAFFDETKLTDFKEPISGQFGTSRYKVFYHIYAGNNEDVSFSVFLRAVDANEMPISSYPPIFLERGRNLAKGQFATNNAITKESPSGYNQVCVEIAGDRYGRHSECGFGKASSEFAVDYLTDAYAKSQLTNKNIKSAEECVPEQGLSSGFNTGVGPGLITSTVGALSPGLLSTGVVRKCSAYNPGIGETDTTWVPVGVCGKDEQGRDLGTCWLYANNAANVIKNNMAALQDVNQSFLSPLQKQLEEKGLGLDLIGKDLAIIELKALSDALEENKLAGYKDLDFENIIRRYNNLIEKSFLPEVLAPSYSGLGLAYYSYGNFLLKLTPTEADRLALEQRKKDDAEKNQLYGGQYKPVIEQDKTKEVTYLFNIGDKINVNTDILKNNYNSVYTFDYPDVYKIPTNAPYIGNDLALAWLLNHQARVVNEDESGYTLEWTLEGQDKSDLLNLNPARFDLVYSNFNTQLSEDQRYVINNLGKDSMMFNKEQVMTTGQSQLEKFYDRTPVSQLQKLIDDSRYQLKTKNFIGLQSKVGINLEKPSLLNRNFGISGDRIINLLPYFIEGSFLADIQDKELIDIVRGTMFKNYGEKYVYYIQDDGDIYLLNEDDDASELKEPYINLNLRFTFKKDELESNSKRYDPYAVISQPQEKEFEGPTILKVPSSAIKSQFMGIISEGIGDEAASNLASLNAFLSDVPNQQGFKNVFWSDYSNIRQDLKKLFIFSNFNTIFNEKQIDSIGQLQETFIDDKDTYNKQSSSKSFTLGSFTYFVYTFPDSVQVIFKIDDALLEKIGKKGWQTTFPTLGSLGLKDSTITSFLYQVLGYAKTEFNLDFYPIKSSGTLFRDNALIFATPQNTINNLMDLAVSKSISYKAQADGSILLSQSFPLTGIQSRTQTIVDNNYIEYDSNVPVDLSVADITYLMKKHGLTLSLKDSDVDNDYLLPANKIMKLESKKVPVSAFLNDLTRALTPYANKVAEGGYEIPGKLEMRIQPDGSIAFKTIKSLSSKNYNSDLIDYLDSMKAEFGFNYETLENGDIIIYNVYPKIGYKFRDSDLQQSEGNQYSPSLTQKASQEQAVANDK